MILSSECINCKEDLAEYVKDNTNLLASNGHSGKCPYCSFDFQAVIGIDSVIIVEKK